MAKDDRKRDFAFLLYPESCDPNYIRILRSLHTPVLISPLHNQDVFEDGENKGEKKKPHFHVLVSFDGKKNPDVVLDVMETLKANMHLEEISSKRGMVRYFFHLDEPPEVPRYKIGDCVCLNGFDIEPYVAEKDESYVASIIEICNKEAIRTFRGLVFRIRDEPLLLKITVKYAYFFTAFLRTS